MHKQKRIFHAWLIALAIVIMLCTLASCKNKGEDTQPAAPTSSEGLEFALNEDGQSYTCTGIGTCTASEIVIDTYNGLPVTKIGQSAFQNNSSITSVTLGDNVKFIELVAFGECASLRSVTLGKNVETVGEAAFYRCESLSSVTIPEKVMYIQKSAFYFCTSLTSVALPQSLINIGESAFEGCSRLESVKLPESLTKIGERAFYGCDNIAQITVPGKVDTVVENAFAMCRRLETITLLDGVKEIKKNSFDGCVSLKSIYVPRSVTLFEDAIQGSYQLKDVYFGGTEAEFAEISPSSIYFDGVNVHYNYKTE